MRNWNVSSINSLNAMRKNVLGHFNAKVGREEINNNNRVRLVNTAPSKTLAVKSTMLPHRSIYKYIWPSPDGKTHTQIDRILIIR
jgi:hypothetical protein